MFPVVSVRGLKASSKFARLFDVYNAKDGSLRLGSALDRSSEHTTSGCDVTVSLKWHAKIASPSVPYLLTVSGKFESAIPIKFWYNTAPPTRVSTLESHVYFGPGGFHFTTRQGFWMAKYNSFDLLAFPAEPIYLCQTHALTCIQGV